MKTVIMLNSFLNLKSSNEIEENEVDGKLT